MCEVKRVIFNLKFLICLALVVAVGAVMFVSGQAESGSENPVEYQSKYNTVLKSYENMSIADTLSDIEQKASEYETLESICSIYEFKDDNPEVFSSRLEFYKSEYPDAVKKYESGDVDAEEIQTLSKIYGELLEKAEYISGYGDYLDGIAEQSEKLSAFSVFGSGSGFSENNITKTADDFSKLENTDLQLIADGAEGAFLSFKASDYLIFALILFVCFEFLAERKKGLWAVIYSSSGGRARLAVKRVLILLVTSALSVVLVYGVNLILSFYIYGGLDCLDAPVQSVEILGNFPANLTIARFLAIYFILKIFAVFLVSLLIYALMAAVNNVKYSIAVTAVFLTAEYVLFAFLPVQSAANVLKYFNIFSYVNLPELFTNYLNINLFGCAVNIRSVCIVSMLPLCAVFAAVCVLIQKYKRPGSGKNILGKAALKLNSVTDKVTSRFHFLAFEVYKLLILQKGIAVLAVLAVIMFNFNYVSFIEYSEDETLQNEYYARLQGGVTQTTLDKIESLISDNETTIEACEATIQKYSNGTTPYDEYYTASLTLDDAYKTQTALSAVKQRADRLYDENEGLWLVNEEGVKSILGCADSNALGYNQNCADKQNKIVLLSLIALILTLGGVFSFETQHCACSVLKSTANGRSKLFVNKICASLITAAMVWIISYVGEFTAILQDCSEVLNAPVHSFTIFEGMQANIIFWQFLALLYAYRLAALCFAALAVAFVSSHCRVTNLSYIISCGALLVPSVMYGYFGLSSLRFISASYYLSPLLSVIPADGSLSTLCAELVVIAATGVVLVILSKKQYLKHSG